MAYPAAAGAGTRHRIVLRCDPDLEPDVADMEFRLTWAGSLLAHRNDKRLAKRSLAVHRIRGGFHVQLQKLRHTHPVFRDKPLTSGTYVGTDLGSIVYSREGFNWVPIATKANGLICKLEIVLLRDADPGDTLADIDNRLKTIFDALKMPSGPDELGQGTTEGKQVPQAGEDPFCVLLEDDSLITHLAVSTDRLLEDVPDAPRDTAARLVIGVTIRPYEVHLENAKFI